MPEWSIETHTRWIREVKQSQIYLNPLIGLRVLSKKSYFINISLYVDDEA